MDNFQRNNQDGSNPQPQPLRKKPGTGSLSADSFQASKTGPLSPSNTTKRLSSGPLDPVKVLDGLATEVRNGQLLLSKLEGRMAVLERAVRIVEKPIDMPKIMKGVGSGEADFTKRVAQLLQQDSGIKRRVEVALYQYQQAANGVEHSQGVIERAGAFEGIAKAQFLETNAHLEKLRGQLYPLLNLHMVFKDTPLLAQLIPAPQPKEPSGPLSAAVPAASAPQQAPPRLTGSGSLADDPDVQQVMDALGRVTGKLKDKLLGAFRKES